MIVGALWSIGWGELAMLMTIGIFLLMVFLVVFTVINRQGNGRDDQRGNKP
jgi:hypothetical protein